MSNIMMNHNEFSVIFAKPLLCGTAGALIDRYAYSQPSMYQNLAFGSAVALGVLTADQIAKRAPGLGSQMNRSLEARALEIGIAGGLALGYDAYMFNRKRGAQMGSRFLAVAASEVVGDYAFHSLYM
jgi:hypothetical protein